MKRRKLLQHLQQHGCAFPRELFQVAQLSRFERHPKTYKSSSRRSAIFMRERNFEWAIPVNRNHDSLTVPWDREDVVTPVNPRQPPPALLKHSRQQATGDLLHTATSMIWSAVFAPAASSSASSQPSIASRMFVRSWSTVSPWETQPGRAGTSAQ